MEIILKRAGKVNRREVVNTDVITFGGVVVTVQTDGMSRETEHWIDRDYKIKTHDDHSDRLTYTEVTPA